MPERRARTGYFMGTDYRSKEELVLGHLPMIKKIAGKLSIALPAALDHGDLVGSGIIGLLEAYERYDPSRGVNFSAYASLRIRGAMIDQIRKVSFAPRSFFSRLRQVQETAEMLRKDLEREPDNGEIATQLGWPESGVEEVWLHYNLLAVVSLDKLLFEEMGDDSFALVDLLATPEEAPESALLKKEKQHLLAAALQKLPAREKLLLSLYYYENLTQKEIAGLMKISIARVSQLHARAIRRLQEILANRV